MNLSACGGANAICPVGVVNVSFPLSDQPVFGEWLVFAEVQGYTYNKSFEVQKYGKGLPPPSPPPDRQKLPGVH